ncbi:MAG: thermonuclease family protein [Hyphomicrobiaceae bacterium]
MAIALAAGFQSAPVSARPAARSVAVAPGAAVSGRAQVVDGDTLDIAGVRVRLEGIDAPETGQHCKRRLLGTWDCGGAATRALTKMVEGETVTCASRGQDKYGRMLGVCYAKGAEINARLVREGHAWAFFKYSKAYVADEAVARSNHLGVFSVDGNMPPWDYRAGAWRTAEQVAPEGCAIKGNVSRKGRIYHMPWSPWYQRVGIDAARGERWFCTEAEAIAAGWRPVEGS